MSMTVEERKATNKALIDEVLKAYPDKMAKRRAKHLGQYEEGKPDCGVKSNIKSLPGVMTIRGCAYAGSKGVVWGPIKDMVHISHGPVGCGQYSWAARRNYYIGTTGIDTFVTMQFTSDFQEKDIVFGGDKKLDKIIDEIQELFPLNKGISHPERMPDRPDRRRHRGGQQEEEQGVRRPHHRAGALRGLPRRQPVAGPPPGQRRHPRLGVRQARRARSGPSSRARPTT
jgi:hypothetical protein